MARIKLPWEIPTVVVVTLTGQLQGTPAGHFHLRPPHGAFGLTKKKGTLAYQLTSSKASTTELNDLVAQKGIKSWVEKFPTPLIVLYRDGFLTLALEEPNQGTPPASFAGDIQVLIEGFDACAELLGASH